MAKLLYEAILHVPAPGTPPQAYTTRFPERLTPAERQYVAAQLLGLVLQLCEQELGTRPRFAPGEDGDPPQQI